MIPLATFVTPPSPCGYLSDRVWQLKYEIVADATADDYERLLVSGWRRFGRAFFRPQCPSCVACQSIRVDVERFRMDRSQRRNKSRNQQEISLWIGQPDVSPEKLDLYDRYHHFQVENVGWDVHEAKNEIDYEDSFVDNPFPAEEWCYYYRERLVGVGYVDAVASGLSAIYFFHEPEMRSRGLGTWNVLSVIAEAARRGLPYVYLGYFVSGCRSLEYKARFKPSEVFDLETMSWSAFDEQFPHQKGNHEQA